LNEVLRVQQNTRQLVFFLPLWLFCFYVSPLWGGVVRFWLVGRIVYAWGYYQAAEKRTIGFGISSISGMVLLLGSLFGIILSLVRLKIDSHGSYQHPAVLQKILLMRSHLLKLLFVSTPVRTARDWT